MVLISHPTGNANVAAVLRGLSAANRPFRFHTTLGLAAETQLPSFLPASLRRELERRRFPVSKASLDGRPGRELVRLLAIRSGFGSLVHADSSWASVQSVYCDLDAHIAARHVAQTPHPDVVYAYEDGARATFATARRLGIPTVYDLPIAYWEPRQELLRGELARWPEWAPTMPGIVDSEEKLSRKSEELELADAVVCPSKFVFDSLPESARATKRCMIAQFGSPTVSEPPAKGERSGQRLRVLFAGSMTQRKGLADVFAAMKLVARPEIELVVLGSPVAGLDFYRKQYPDFTYAAPRPHRAVLELMASCDLLVLPSIAEGRALVQQEAMSCGLPILVTPNAGAEDLVDEGITGFLVPIRAPERIAERLSWCADHRDALREMRVAARAKAACYTWEAYGQKVVALIEEMMQPARAGAVSTLTSNSPATLQPSVR